MISKKRRTASPWSSWSKGLLAFSILIITSIVVFLTVDEQSVYISIEDAISGDYVDGDKLQIHGTVTSLKLDDCILLDGNFSIRIDISSLILPDTFAEDKSATFTGILRIIGDEIIFQAENVQMGCPSKYEPAEG